MQVPIIKPRHVNKSLKKVTSFLMLKHVVNNHQSKMKDCNALICLSVYSFLLSFIILFFLSFISLPM
jgi:hypothetical protein